jgi:ATP dependent DNA ligase domain
VRHREPQPNFVQPMLLTAGAVPDGDSWSLEVKWDGCRAQLRYDGRTVTLRTRSGRECSDDFPELLFIADALGKRRVILDGELVCLRDDGRPDFAWLRVAWPAPAPIPRLRFCRSSTSSISTAARPWLCPTASVGRCSWSSRSTGPRGARPRA